MALEALCEIESYRGDAERLIELSQEAMRVGEESGHGMFSSAMRNYLAGAYLQKGNVEAARDELRKGEKVLVAGDDQTLLGWNLYVQALIALILGQPDDAASLHERQIEVARQVGYIRVLALGLSGLGHIQIQTGDADSADGNLRESLEIFEKMGLVAEICYVATLLARVMSMRGDIANAVETASCVRADPSSERPFLFETTPIAESATELLHELSGMMESEAFASAVARGEMMGLDVLDKELLTESRFDHSAGA
jgi:tetratricopeptide (TPR) repeat protein